MSLEKPYCFLPSQSVNVRAKYFWRKGRERKVFSLVFHLDGKAKCPQGL